MRPGPGISAMERTPDISFNQRFAVVGKTRSGKSTYGIILSSLLVPWKRKARSSDPEVWFIDTKHDPRDMQALFEWGFRPAPEATTNYKIFSVYGDGEKKIKPWQNAQRIFAIAFRYGGVLVVVDEYTQTVPSRVDAGDDLLDVFTRGGGLDVGIVGLTQQPVYVPRELLSQASHQMLFDLSYPNDIKKIREFFEPYQRPLLRGDKHGFYHIATDYDGLGVYYKHYKEWVISNDLLERIAA